MEPRGATDAQLRKRSYLPARQYPGSSRKGEPLSAPSQSAALPFVGIGTRSSEGIGILECTRRTFSMDLELIVGTLPLAASYFLLGLSFVLIYRSSKVVNFAAGELAILSPYILLALPMLGAAWLPMLAVASWVVAALVAAGLFLVTLRTITGYSAMPAILATFAMSIVLRSLIELVWTSQPQFILHEAGVTLSPLKWGPLRTLTWADIAIVLVGLLVSMIIWAILRFTVLGTRMRAVSESQVLASYRGIDVNLTLATVWSLAALVAGIAGTYYAFVTRLSPSVALYGLRALSVPLLGGLDSVTGTLVASLLVAFVERASTRFGGPLLGEVAPFALLLIALWVRPWGLFGRPEEIERV